MNIKKLTKEYHKYKKEHDKLFSTTTSSSLLQSTINNETGIKARGGFHQIERTFLYSTIRSLKCKNILEISPDKGLTTHIIIGALAKNNEKAKLLSYDVHNQSQYLDQSWSKDCLVERTLITGSAQNTVNISDVKKCDFLFIDSDHSYAFGKWYSQNIIPHLAQGTLIFVHDWPGYDHDGCPNNGIDPNRPHTPSNSEPLAVKEHCIASGIATPIGNLFEIFDSPSNCFLDSTKYACIQILMRL